LTQPPPTVINRFVSAVVAGLAERDCPGAAEAVFSSAATLEPGGRYGQIELEHQRLLLLADRAARKWVPAAVATQRDPDLELLAAGWPRVARPADAADAAERLGGLRGVLAGHRPGPGAVAPAEMASALAPVQAALRHVGQSAEDPRAAAVVAVPQFAKGLVDLFLGDVGFGSDGIPGETAATVAVLDARDERQAQSHGYGTPGMERTAGESDLHRTLVSLLVSHLAQGSGEVTHAESGTLPQPPRVERHRPDVAGRGLGGGVFIGEAKTGPDLFHEHTQEQLEDFSTYRLDGERVAFHLMVPGGWRGEAERAIRHAGGEVDDFVVVYEVANVPGATAPAT
jgi:hypothetical protein